MRNLWLHSARAALTLLSVAALPLYAQQSPSKPVGAAASPGAIEGVVRLAGSAVARPTMIENSTDPQLCGKLHSLEDLLVDPKSRGIRHVIVALTDVPRAAVPSHRPRELLLHNTECRFVPHAAVLRVGDSIRAVNNDPLLHNVHYYGPFEANLALPNRGSSLSRTVRRPGTIVVKCDVHGWMQAFIRVDDHPFHAVTDAEGRFHIADVPEGVYTLELWHEKLGLTRRTIRVERTKTASIEVGYSLDER